MALTDFKLTDAGITANGVQSQPDKLTGTAEENKLVFDKLIADVVKGCLNGLIDAIMGTGGAAGVGISAVPGLTGVTSVQGALAKIEDQLQDITQGSVADGSITTAKLAALAVTAEKLAAGCVTAEKLADGAVETAKISDSAVTAAKLEDGAVETAKIKDGSVTTGKLSDDCVTNAKIGSGAVGTTELDDMAVTTAKLMAGAVTAAKLGAGAVETAKIKDGNVTADKLAASAVTAAKLNADVTPAAIGAAGLSGGKLLPAQSSSEAPVITANYTVTAADMGKCIRTSGTNAITITVPLAGTICGDDYGEFEVIQYGEGTVTFAGAVLSLNGAKVSAGQYACFSLKRVNGYGYWVLSGALV